MPATETNYLRPRYIKGSDEAGKNMAALIGVSPGKEGHLCWGIVGDDGEFVMENQQMTHYPWSGVKLPATLDELKAVIG